MVWGLWKGDILLTRKNWLAGHFKALSIGNVMALTYKKFLEADTNKKTMQNSVFYLFLMASMAFFSLAT
jgi:hypothetical protein